MIKSLLTLCLLFSMAFSVIAPSVSNLLNFECDEVALIDVSEGDSQKEVETNVDEDIVIIESVMKVPTYYLDTDNGILELYKDDSSIYFLRIHLPPPEYKA